MRRTGYGCLVLGFWLTAAASEIAAAASFDGLGYLHGGAYSEATGVSADGAVVVGTSGTQEGQPQAFRWTAPAGIVGLPRPEGLAKSWAADVSADGNYVAGWASNSVTTPVGTEAVRWDVAGARHDRLAMAGAGVVAKGISDDGQWLVGGAGDQAVRWSAADGMLPLHGPLYPGEVRSTADDISADGQVVLGDILEVATSTRDAFRWTDAGGMVGLSAFTASAASRDGSVIVGTLATGPRFQAYRWTAESGMVPLETLGPDNHARAMGVSGDGSIVVGYVQSDSDDSQHAFLWDAAHGMRLVREVLQSDFGLDLSAWDLTRAAAISDDGSTIVGVGYNAQHEPEAWRAVVPEPSALALAGLAGLSVLGYSGRRRKG